MSFVNQARTKRLIALHGWSGTLLGLLLYVVIFTGALVVFEEEIDQWSRGALAREENLGEIIDHAFRAVARTVDRAYYEDVAIFRLPGGDLRYVFHGHQTDEVTGQIVEPMVRITVDGATGAILERWEGVRTDQPAEPRSALRDFWVDLHVQLYLPNPYGLILVGVLGLMMMFAAVSGVLMHKHLLRDVFLSPRSTLRLSGARDLHVLAGTWGVPFAVVLAFTGAFFGFATTVGLPAMSMIAFGGDQEAIVEMVLGAEEEADLTPMPLAPLDFVLRDAEARGDAPARRIQITHYDSAGAKIRVFLAPSPGQLAPQILGFEGVSRAFTGHEPLIGTAPSWGASLLALIAPLHFGNFAGFASKLVWLGMGLAMAYVTATGVLLWAKRREDQPLWRGFRHWILVTVWGLPLAMLVSAVAFFVSAPLGDPHLWTPLGFLLGVAAVGALGLAQQDPGARLRLANAVLCLALPVLRHLMGGTSWSEALIGGGTEILVIDILLLGLGLGLLRAGRAPSAQQSPPVTVAQEPAE